MKATLYDIGGKKAGEVSLPAVFDTEYRPDLIKRAVRASISARIQPWGPDPMAGQRTSAENWGKGSGMARVRRIKAGAMKSSRGAKRFRTKFRSFHAAGRAAFVPGTVGGRRAHPPKVEAIRVERINTKERKKAVASALAATCVQELIAERGHKIDNIKSFPLIIEDKIEGLEKTSDIMKVFKAIGLADDVERATIKKIRAGRGKMRGRKYRKKTGPLVVISEPGKASQAVRNLAGVDVVPVSALNAEVLSPGAHGARLAVFSKKAISKIEERFK